MHRTTRSPLYVCVTATAIPYRYNTVCHSVACPGTPCEPVEETMRDLLAVIVNMRLSSPTPSIPPQSFVLTAHTLPTLQTRTHCNGEGGEREQNTVPDRQDGLWIEQGHADAMVRKVSTPTTACTSTRKLDCHVQHNEERTSFTCSMMIVWASHAHFPTHDENDKLCCQK